MASALASREGWVHEKDLHSLHAACEHDHQSAVRRLLRRGDDPDAVGDDVAGEAPLHIAAEKGLQVIAAQLLAAGASPAARANDGSTPLHLAAHCGRTAEHVDVLHLLLQTEAGWTSLATNKRGETPVHLASKAGHCEAVEALLEGSDEAWRALQIEDHCGKTPMDWATQRGHKHVTPLLLEWESRRVLTNTRTALDETRGESERWKERALVAERTAEELYAQLAEQSQRADAEAKEHSALAAAANLSKATDVPIEKQLRSALDAIIGLREQLDRIHAENAHLHQKLARAERWRTGWVASHDIRMSGTPATAPPHRRAR